MRIVIATDAWAPQINGVVTTQIHLIKELQSMGHTVLVIEPGHFKTIPCPGYSEIRLAIRPYRRVKTLLDAFKPHAIHISTEGPIGHATRRYCMKNQLKFTTAYHTRFPEYMRAHAHLPLALTYAAMRRFHGAAAQTMVATEGLREELTARGLTNLILWTRGVDTELFRPRKKMPLAGKHPISMYVGRVSAEKNVRAFLDLDFPGTKYVVGGGPELTSLMERYPDVIFAGPKSGAELAQYYASADVFVFPSKTDTFGLVILEANACGVPVAAYPVQGPKELVHNGVNGWVSDNLYEAVEQALTVNPQSCRAYAEQFTWRKSTEQFLSNLRQLPDASL